MVHFLKQNKFELYNLKIKNQDLLFKFNGDKVMMN